jgi:hypothetical protein
MSVTAEESQLAERVVAKSRNEARVDTGRLKDSINKKVQRGVIVFREYYYGAYPETNGRKNSTLEENARAMMGNVPYKIERLDEEGDIVEGVNKATSGRVATYERQKKRESNADALAAAIRAKRKKDDEREKDTRKDN